MAVRVQRARTREVDAWASWLRGLKIAAARLNSERRRVQGLKDGDGETTPELGSLVSASGLWRSREEVAAVLCEARHEIHGFVLAAVASV
ncbi:hypothetical protein M0R45_004850 [Rubus argutus]|uniref:Uncharacterized protein n=1 Tax=Rubus argutus TaxID=59490 RepID=A0AAW1YKR6_RUBAR